MPHINKGLVLHDTLGGILFHYRLDINIMNYLVIIEAGRYTGGISARPRLADGWGKP